MTWVPWLKKRVVYVWRWPYFRRRLQYGKNPDFTELVNTVNAIECAAPLYSFIQSAEQYRNAGKFLDERKALVDAEAYIHQYDIRDEEYRKVPIEIDGIVILNAIIRDRLIELA